MVGVYSVQSLVWSTQTNLQTFLILSFPVIESCFLNVVFTINNFHVSL